MYIFVYGLKMFMLMDLWSLACLEGSNMQTSDSSDSGKNGIEV